MPKKGLKADAKGVSQLDNNIVIGLSVPQVAPHAFLWHQKIGSERVGSTLNVASAREAFINPDRVRVLEEEMTELVGNREALTAEVNGAVNERNCGVIYSRIQARYLLTHRLKGY